MKNLTLENIAKAVGGVLHAQCIQEGISVQETEAVSVQIDSRKIVPGAVFIATRGERVDGHSFIGNVFAAGALGVICEKVPQSSQGAYILVEDSFQALRDLAEYYRSQLDIQVVGITGSVGKTSTKEFVASVLSRKYQVCKTEGNYNNEIGLPLTVLRIDETCEVAVLEMGISDFGEMHRLSKIARPDVCLITNIGQCHLENLGSRDGILRAKSEIFDFMRENGKICLNGDDDKLALIRDVKGSVPVFFGKDAVNAVTADAYENRGLAGSRACIHVRMQGMNKDFVADIPLPGEHMLYNALAATAVGMLFGVETDQIQAGIRDVEPVGGRSHIICTEYLTLIDDCYNANPVSVKAALDLLSMTDLKQNGRKVAVLGDMFELGADETVLHAQVGAYAVQKQIEVVICIGTLCRYMYEGAKECGIDSCAVYHFADKAAFYNHMGTLLQQKDIVLVKASHGMHFEEITQRLEKWSS